MTTIVVLLGLVFCGVIRGWQALLIYLVAALMETLFGGKDEN